ncbi:MAG: acetylglutamate kinase [Kiritimatiellae bacterium]|nr:acetylglutamate kinase [Kiritimatiellia bacterium]
MQKFIEKTNVLMEAMPYIRLLRGKPVVIKFGGSAMENTDNSRSILADVAFMECVGIHPVIVHGGGGAISRRMREAGIQPKFVNGLRVTDSESMRVVEEVLNHEVNVEIVETLIASGARATGLHGPGIISAEKRVVQDNVGVDLGFVGRVAAVDTAPITACLQADIIPVITPLGRGPDGRVYNINADDSAAAVAVAINAFKLVFLSDVPGVMRDAKDADSVISSLTRSEIEALIRSRVIQAGMIPKIQGALAAMAAGVRKVHIIDGHVLHSLLLEIFTDKGIGTEIINDN